MWYNPHISTKFEEHYLFPKDSDIDEVREPDYGVGHKKKYETNFNEIAKS